MDEEEEHPGLEHVAEEQIVEEQVDDEQPDFYAVHRFDTLLDAESFMNKYTSLFCVKYTTTRIQHHKDDSHIFFQSPKSCEHAPVPFTGTPFRFINEQIYFCYKGSAFPRKKRSQAKIRKSSVRKIDCPARITIRHIVEYPEYTIRQSNKSVERAAKEALRNALYPKKVNAFLIHISNNHNHPIGTPDPGYEEPIDPELMEYIKRLALTGITKYTVVDSLLHAWRRERNIKESPRRQYNPSRKDVNNYIYKFRRESAFPKSDQENLQQLYNTLKYNGHNTYFKPAKSEGKHNVVFIYQSPEQAVLMNLYGSDMLLLDAVYRKVEYPLPMYFLHVRTNLKYIVVAVFVLIHPNAESISEALTKLLEWNKGFFPRNVLVSNNFNELEAVKKIFPDSKLYFCDYYLKQAWERWTDVIKNGVKNNKESVMEMLLRIAWAPTERKLFHSISDLQNCDLYIGKLEKWFEGEWLPQVKMWAFPYKDSSLRVSLYTNDGLEMQNETLKYERLSNLKGQTLSQVLSFLCNYFQNSYNEYISVNADWAFEHQKHKKIPGFLNNTLNYVLDHCNEEFEAATEYSFNDIIFYSDCATLPKLSGRGVHKIRLSEFTCDCKIYCKTMLPCRHIICILEFKEEIDEVLTDVLKHPVLQIDHASLNSHTKKPIASDEPVKKKARLEIEVKQEEVQNDIAHASGSGKTNSEKSVDLKFFTKPKLSKYALMRVELNELIELTNKFECYGADVTTPYNTLSNLKKSMQTQVVFFEKNNSPQKKLSLPNSVTNTTGPNVCKIAPRRIAPRQMSVIKDDDTIVLSNGQVVNMEVKRVIKTALERITGMFVSYDLNKIALKTEPLCENLSVRDLASLIPAATAKNASDVIQTRVLTKNIMHALFSVIFKTSIYLIVDPVISANLLAGKTDFDELWQQVPSPVCVILPVCISKGDHWVAIVAVYSTTEKCVKVMYFDPKHNYSDASQIPESLLSLVFNLQTVMDARFGDNWAVGPVWTAFTPEHKVTNQVSSGILLISIIHDFLTGSAMSSKDPTALSEWLADLLVENCLATVNCFHVCPICNLPSVDNPVTCTRCPQTWHTTCLVNYNRSITSEFKCPNVFLSSV